MLPLRRVLSALLLVLVAPLVSTARAEDPPAPFELTILHTNDLHGQVLEPSRGPGGLVALGRTIRQERDRARARGDAVLLLDAGDIYKGTPEGDLTDGQAVIAWMNHVGYDALAVGNHEFDHGIAVVAKLAEKARFPLLGGNIVLEQGGGLPAWLGRQPAEPASGAAWDAAPAELRGAVVVRTLTSGRGRSARVAVVGLTTSDMKLVTLKGVTDGLTFADEVETLRRLLAQLATQAGPVDLVVLLTHCGVDVDQRVAEALPGQVAVIVGGHSHTRLPEGKRQGETLICQTGARSQALGVVRVTLEHERRVTSSARLVAAGDDLAAALQPFVDEVKVKADVTLGHLAVDLPRASGPSSSHLGNLHCDLMRQASGADLAFHNKTGIRADLVRGVVRWRDVYQVAPFGNTVATLRMKGSDVRALCEGMLEAPPKLLEVSGLVVSHDMDRPVGQRVVEITVAGAPLDPERTYLVATNNFLAPGGDGHVAFTKGTDLKDTGVVLLDLLLDHFKRHATAAWDPGPLDQRLRKAGEAAPPPAPPKAPDSPKSPYAPGGPY